MSVRGRKPTPTKLRILRGNPGKRPLPKDEPEPASLEQIPPPPADLDEIAAKEWRTLATEMLAIGLLTKLDLGLFHEYCWTWSELLRHQRMLRESGRSVFVPKGSTYPQFSPYFTASLKLSARLQSLIGDLGLSASSRTRINAGMGGTGDGAGDEFDKWQRSGAKKKA